MEMEVEVGDIEKKLNEVRFSDIAPRDIEAEEHAREHLEDGMDVNEELADKREIEKLEDMFGGLGGVVQQSVRPTVEGVSELERRVDELVNQLITSNRGMFY